MKFYGELGVWPRDQLITFRWRSASLSRSGSPFRITIRIRGELAFGGGLCSLSTSSVLPLFVCWFVCLSDLPASVASRIAYYKSVYYYYLRRRRLCFHLGLFVYLFVCPSDNWKSWEHILTKFLGGVGHSPGTNEFNFGDDPDHRPDPGVRSGSRSLSGKNCHVVNTQNRCPAKIIQRFYYAGLLAFGGGLCSVSEYF